MSCQGWGFYEFWPSERVENTELSEHRQSKVSLFKLVNSELLSRVDRGEARLYERNIEEVPDSILHPTYGAIICNCACSGFEYGSWFHWNSAALPIAYFSPEMAEYFRS